MWRDVAANIGVVALGDANEARATTTMRKMGHSVRQEGERCQGDTKRDQTSWRDSGLCSLRGESAGVIVGMLLIA